MTLSATSAGRSRRATATPAPVPGRRQRVDADAHVGAARARGPRGANTTSLADLDQRGGAKIRLPRAPGDALHAVTINTAGGLTGGDRIGWSAHAGAGSHLILSSAACEKAYRSHGPEAHQSTALSADAGARLEWLPQETILQEGARLERTLEADLEGDAALLACEAVTLGRAAMGETVRRARLVDRWRVRRDGRLVHAEALVLGEDFDALHADAAGLGPWHAFATAVLCDAREACAHEDLVERVNAAIEAAIGGARPAAGDAAPGLARASALPGRVVVRVLARDSRTLRAALLPALGALRDGAPTPRVWSV